jgi:hypothetical protein
MPSTKNKSKQTRSIPQAVIEPPPIATPRSPGISGRWDVIVPLLIAFFPVAWLLLRVDHSFALDWNNHVWMAAYFGEYLQRHWHFPLTLNTDQVIGIPFPVFYGSLFYPIAGLISTVIGGDLAIRILMGGILWLQAVQVVRVSKCVHPSKYVAWGLSAIACFAIYPLTNLYNRSAITEFVAASLLVSACSLWLTATWVKEEHGWKDASLSWLLFALCAGTHPITALLGSGIFGLLIVSSFVLCSDRRKILRLLVWNVVGFLVVLAPWIYATVHFRNDLAVSQVSTGVNVMEFDQLWVRLMPFPFDSRTLSEPLNKISTPYLDAQINIGLLILVGFLAFQVIRRIRAHKMSVTKEVWIAVSSLVLFIVVMYCSITRIWDSLPQFFSIVQFSYRLVTYCDLLLLFAALLLFKALKQFRAEIKTGTIVCLVGCFAVMADGVILKFTHAAAIENPATLPGAGLSHERKSLTQLPGTFYGVANYVVSNGSAGKLPLLAYPLVQFKPGVDRDFGVVKGTESISLNQPSTVATNVQSFPWNGLTLDGEDVPPDKIYSANSEVLAMNMNAGKNVVGYKFSPDPVYSGLRILSALALLGWIALWSAVSIGNRLRIDHRKVDTV